MNTHAIDPCTTRCLGIFCWVDAHRIELTAEDLVRETQVVTDALVEAVVAHCNVKMAPAELPCVDTGAWRASSKKVSKVCGSSVRSLQLQHARHDAGIEARVVRPLQQIDRQVIVVREVELEPPQSIRVTRSCVASDTLHGSLCVVVTGILNRDGPGRGQRVRETELSCDSSYWQLALWMVDLCV